MRSAAHMPLTVLVTALREELNARGHVWDLDHKVCLLWYAAGRLAPADDAVSLAQLVGNSCSHNGYLPGATQELLLNRFGGGPLCRELLCFAAQLRAEASQGVSGPSLPPAAPVAPLATLGACTTQAALEPHSLNPPTTGSQQTVVRPIDTAAATGDDAHRNADIELPQCDTCGGRTNGARAHRCVGALPRGRSSRTCHVCNARVPEGVGNRSTARWAAHVRHCRAAFPEQWRGQAAWSRGASRPQMTGPAVTTRTPPATPSPATAAESAAAPPRDVDMQDGANRPTAVPAAPAPTAVVAGAALNRPEWWHHLPLLDAVDLRGTLSRRFTPVRN